MWWGAVHLLKPVCAGAANAPGGDGSGSRTDCNLTNLNIPIIQCNLNKAHGAQVELLHKINKVQSYIALITEPYCYKYKLSLPPKNSKVIPAKRVGQPRAAIFCSKNLIL